MPQFTVSDLMNMGRYKAVISMRSEDGTSRAAFNVDPVHGADISKDKAIVDREWVLRRASVANHTPMSYDDVNAWLTARYNPPPPPNGGSNQDNGTPHHLTAKSRAKAATNGVKNRNSWLFKIAILRYWKQSGEGDD